MKITYDFAIEADPEGEDFRKLCYVKKPRTFGHKAFRMSENRRKGNV